MNRDGALLLWTLYESIFIFDTHPIGGAEQALLVMAVTAQVSAIRGAHALHGEGIMPRGLGCWSRDGLRILP